MPGYTCVVFEKDTKSFHPKYLCTCCGNILRDPVQTICGHRYCKSCVESLLRTSSSKCLVDNAEITPEKIFEDKFARREILSLPVQCANQTDGCNWTGELGHLEVCSLSNGQDHKVQCPYTKVQCIYPSCGVLVLREDLSRHLEEECMFRQQQCQYCKLMTTADQLKEHEENNCKEYPVDCPKCSTVKLPRKQLSKHLDPVNGDCEAVEVPCAFESIGCKHGNTMKREESRDHQDKEAVHHLSYLLLFVQRLADFCYSKMGDLKAFEKSQVITSMGNTIESLLHKVDAIVNESSNFSSILNGHGTRISNLEQSTKRFLMDDVFSDSNPLNSSLHRLSQVETKRILQMLENEDAKTANHELLLVELNAMLQNQNKEAKRLETQLKTANDEIRKLQRRSEHLEHTLSARNFAIAELEDYVKQEQFSSFDGVLLWKITDFARRRNEATTGQPSSTYSPCFYTSRRGYKMCARIYLNGDGKGKGTHISVFFVILRGQYDALLRWPFRQKITFMLMDQDNLEHVIDSFRPDPSSSSFQRPQRETNIASGCPTFCPLSELNNHAYVKDDTMFIKVIVDTTDL